jgi:hypothetical protein
VENFSVDSAARWEDPFAVPADRRTIRAAETEVSMTPPGEYSRVSPQQQFGLWRSGTFTNNASGAA